MNTKKYLIKKQSYRFLSLILAIILFFTGNISYLNSYANSNEVQPDALSLYDDEVFDDGNNNELQDNNEAINENDELTDESADEESDDETDEIIEENENEDTIPFAEEMEVDTVLELLKEELEEAYNNMLFQKEKSENALHGILNQKSIYASVYLSEYYQVKDELPTEAKTVVTIPSGHTVEIRGIDFYNGEFWYLTDIYLLNENIRNEEQLTDADFTLFSGYIESSFLAYSDELLLAFENEYLADWFNAILTYENCLFTLENYLMMKEAVITEELITEELDYLTDFDTLFTTASFERASFEDVGLMSNTYNQANISPDIEQFPESYKAALYELKKKYPNWTFVRMNTFQKWPESVAGQIDPPHRSLIYDTVQASWKGAKYEGRWHIATKQAVEFAMDPRNNLTESLIFQFEQLTYNGSYHNLASLTNILSTTFMGKKISDDPRTYAQAFMELGQKYGISPYHLASRVRQEQGVNGTSALISGTYPGYQGFYNYFNVGASGSTTEQVIINGLKTAQNRGWNTRFKSLDGGSSTIGNNYIKKNQDTLYLQKFNVSTANGGAYWHQYMQNIQAPRSEATTIYNSYKNALNNAFVFKIPVYENMSETLVEKITINNFTATMNKGESRNLTVTVLPADASDKRVTWSSSNPAVASIDSNGKLTALASGDTVITATAMDSAKKSASVTLKVSVLAVSVEINTPASPLPVGIPYTLTATVLPADTTNKNVTWVSSNTKVATINKDSGIITPIAAGETVITVTTADAAKKTNKATIKVTVLAESISIDRTELSLEVGDILTMTATIKPALTSDKKVKWASSNANILTINDNGILTANAVGEAYIHAATMDGTNLSTSTKIKVLNGVKSFTISESTHTFNGIGGTHNLIAAAESTGGQKLNVEWKSLNETVATVSANGVVTANGIGNTIITASVLIDNKIHSTLTCVVNVLFAEDLVQDQMDETGFTLPQNDRFSPVTANIMLESYPVNNQSKASLSIMNQYGIMLKEDDVKKFDFQYNNNQIIISDKGEVTPNPSFAPASNTKVTVTATLKNDPLLKRKVTFTVTVVPKAQTKEVKIRHLDSNGNIIKEFANGDYLADYFKTGTPLDTYTLQAIGDKDGLNTKVNWTVTDSSVISLKAGANNTVTVTIRKAGSSGLTVTAQDDFKASQSIIIDAVNSAPLQVERTLTFNRHRTSDNTDLIISDPFNLVEMNGCEIIPNDFIVTSLFRGKLTYEDVAAEMKLHRNSNGTYQLSLPSAALDQLNLAAHTLIVNVPTTSSPRIGGGEGKRDNQLTYTLSIVNRKPTASFTAVAFNLQDLLIEETLLTHRASEKIVSLEPVAGQKNDFDKFFGFKKDLNGNWLIVLKDAARNLTPRTLTGQVNVTMEGFQSITVNMSVRLVNTKDTIIQPIIPQLQYKNDTVALTNLTDRRTGEVLKDYQIVSATPANTLLCTRSNDGTLNLALPNKNYNNGQTIAVTVGVIKTDASGNPIWREPVNVRVSMRVFTAAPIVTTGMSSFNLNTKRKTESAITSMSVNRNNMQITSSNVWRIYYYDTAKKQYILAANPDDLPVRFNYNRAADRLTVSLNPNIEDKAATYQYRIEGMLADFPKVRRDFTVRVGNTDNLRATIAMSGRLDLLKRSESNLGGRIVMTNYTGDIASITLYEIGTTQAQGKINKDFYTVLQANNRFDLKLRNGAIAYTKKTVIPVRLTLSGGSHVDTTLTFTPVQSTPGVTNPAASTFYLNSQNNKAVYGMDTYVNDTAVLKKVVATAPNGITATVDKDNNVTITSASQGIKAGNYNVKVDMYFVGAQPQAGFPDGRPVTRTIRVTVR